MCTLSPATYLRLTGTIFSIITLLHLFRALLSWPARIATWTIPLWASLIALIVSAYLAYTAFTLAQKFPQKKR